MAVGTLMRRRTALGVTLVFLGVLQMLVAGILPSPVSAATVNPGVILGFEGDGNQVVDDTGDPAATPPVPSNLDWANVGASPVYDPDDPDYGLQGSSKENDPTAWTCQTKEGGVTPGKDNIERTYIHEDITEAQALLALAFVREDGGVQGNTHVNFEFNRGDITFDPDGACDYLGRQAGDLLFTFDFPGQTGNPAVINVATWVPDAVIPNEGAWTEQSTIDFTGIAAADDNATDITDLVTGNSETIPARAFGEVVLDLQALNEEFVDNDLPPILTCPGFGTASIRSRSSGSAYESALQDFMNPITVDVSTCGSITIKKVDDAQPTPNPMQGVGFALHDNDEGTGDPIDTCVSAADGTCTFDDVPPGDNYYVFEDPTTVPAGYTPATNPVAGPISVGFREPVDLTDAPIVNPRQTGHVEITKVLAEMDPEGGDDIEITPDDPSDLDGATFLLFDDVDGDMAYDAGEEVTEYNSTDLAECTVTGGAGKCTIGPVATGTYWITETAAPDGTSPGPDVGPVTITAGHTAQAPLQEEFTNYLSPLVIDLEKSGPDEATIGDTFTYTFDVSLSSADDPPLTDISVVELVEERCTASAISGPDKSGGDDDAWLEFDETWRFTCDHLVVEADGTSLHNEARASGTDQFGRTVTDDDDHDVIIRYPDVTVLKEAVEAEIDPGDVIAYDITVSNIGDGVAREVTLDDLLPPDIDDWEVDDTTNCSIVDETDGQHVTCDFGDLGPDDDPITIRISGTTDPLECGLVENTAMVGASNEVEADQANNTSTDDVDVLCPLDIDIEKDGPDLAHVGDEITYTFDVTNTGEVDLVSVTVTDPLCDGEISLDDDADGDTVMAVGETWSYSCTHVVTDDDPDPLPNTATAVGEDDRGREVDDDDPHEVDIIHPDIQIIKTVDNDAPNPGDTITFSYEVTNTGDTTLFDVVVEDDQLGEIGTIDALAPGEVVVLTAEDEVQSDQSLVNVGTATGEDVLGQVVDDDDDEVISIVIPDVVVRPSVLPRTGGPFGVLLLIGGLGVLLGGALLDGSRRLRRR